MIMIDPNRIICQSTYLLEFFNGCICGKEELLGQVAFSYLIRPKNKRATY